MSLFEQVTSWFDSDEWNYNIIEEGEAFTMGFIGDNARWRCYCKVREEQFQIMFYSVAPVNAPEGKRAEVAEFITRANYGLIIGNFELDFSDGEVRYKSSIDVEDATFTAALVRNMVYANVMTMDRYLPGLLGMIHGDLSPTAAIEKVEG